MDTSSCETQFSIYKVDIERVADIFPDEDCSVVEVIVRRLVSEIEATIKSRTTYDWHKCFMYKQLNGILFRTTHTPDWRQALLFVINNNELVSDDAHMELQITNSNISYIMFCTHQDGIYVMTGGYGSFYIRDYIEKNYGLYLLPKLLDKNNPVVKNVIENNLTGNRVSTHRTNRSNTSFVVEQDLSSIYKQLNVEIERDAASMIGVEFDPDESEKKRLNLINKDSIVIRRSLSMRELLKVISKLHSIYKKPDSFVLNYLVPVKKKDIKTSDLVDKLISCFVENKYEAFIIVGDNVEKYVVNSDRYFVTNENGECFIDTREPITLARIVNELNAKGIKTARSLFSKILKKWKIETKGENGENVLFPQKIINTLQGFVEYGDNKLPCYLINGNWYIFDEKYHDFLHREYMELFDYNESRQAGIKTKYKLVKECETENAYNDALKSEANIIVAHTALVQKVEIADAIFWDETTLYLMHNKLCFNGIGARDLLNQIVTSSELLQKNLLLNRSEFLKEYYTSICRRNDIDTLSQANEEEFTGLFSKKICYISGFLKGYWKDTNSTYAKYLTVETKRKLQNKGYEYILLGIR